MPWRWIRMNYEVYHIPTNFTDAGRVMGPVSYTHLTLPTNSLV